MKQNNDVISINQMISILMLTMVGTGVLTLPRNLAVVIPYDHWIILLAGGLVAAVTAVIHSFIIKLRPGKEYFEILCDGLSRPVAYIVGVAYVVYFTVLIGLLTRLFGEVIKVFLLTKTPIEVINISILASCIYLGRKGVEVLGRLITFLLPLIIIITMLIFSLSFIKTDFRNLLPVFKITFIQALKGIPVTILSFIGIEMLLLFGVHLEDPKQSTKAVIAVAAVALFYLLIIAATFAKFGPIQIKYLVWPTLDLFDTIELPGLFIENIQVIVMGTWVITVFTTIAPAYLAGVTMAKSITKSKDHAYLVTPFLPFIYFASLIPENLGHLYEIVNEFNKYFASVVIFVIPTIVLISLVIQGRFRKGAKTSG